MLKKKKKFGATTKILVSTILFILYISFVAFPFLAANQPPNEATSQWAYSAAPLHYALLYFPAFALYVYSICKNILDIQHIRWLIYPIIFIVLFVGAHMLFFVFSMIILWFCILTIPLGLAALIILEVFAIHLDIKNSHKNAENKNKIKKS